MTTLAMSVPSGNTALVAEAAAFGVTVLNSFG